MLKYEQHEESILCLTIMCLRKKVSSLFQQMVVCSFSLFRSPLEDRIAEANKSLKWKDTGAHSPL